MSIRTRLSSALEELSWACTKQLAVLARRSDGRTRLHSVVVVAPTEPGSYGDEAMVAVLAAQLEKSGRNVVFVSFGRRSWSATLGSGTDGPSLSGWRTGLTLLRLLRGVQSVYCIGADVLDGKYSTKRSVRRLEFVAMAARAGVPTRIVSFSINEHPTPAVKKAWAALPSVVDLIARDQRSAQRLEAMIGREVSSGADLAFLLEGRNHPTGLPGGRLLGFVPNHAHASLFGDLANFVDVQERALSEILEVCPDHTLVLFAHDNRGVVSDVDLSRQLADRLGARAHLASVTGPASAHDVMVSLELLVTGRMHAAIGALSECVPALTFGYQDKVEGMLDLFDLPNLCVDPHKLDDPEVLARAVVDLLSDGTVSARLAERRDAVRNLAYRNFYALHLVPAGESGVEAN